jgi:hypothetical protein
LEDLEKRQELRLSAAGSTKKRESKKERTPMTECKFKRTDNFGGCGGGHTTAQHFMNVYERVIKQECGLKAHHEIEQAVNDAAMHESTLLTLVGVVMAMTDCSKEEAVRRAAALILVTEAELANGGKS